MQVEEPDNDDRQWIEDNLRVAENAGFGTTPPKLFEAFEKTLADYLNAEEDIDPTPFMAAFGIAVGEYLRRELDMEWKVITDDYGIDLAILREAPDGSLVYSCPIIVVGKRFDEEYEEGQLEQFCDHFLLTSRAQLAAD